MLPAVLRQVYRHELIPLRPLPLGGSRNARLVWRCARGSAAHRAIARSLLADLAAELFSRRYDVLRQSSRAAAAFANQAPRALALLMAGLYRLHRPGGAARHVDLAAAIGGPPGPISEWVWRPSVCCGSCRRRRAGASSPPTSASS